MQIGNAVINDETDVLGMYQYFGSHALVSQKTVRQMEKHCDFTPGVNSQSKKCIEASNEAEENIDSLDIYNLYAPLCFNTNLTVKPKKITVSHLKLYFFFNRIIQLNLA